MGLALSPDGKTICYSWGTSPFSAYDVATKKRKWASGFFSSFGAARFSGDGRLLVVSHAEGVGKGIAYSVLNASTGRIVSQWRAAALYEDETALDFSSDGRFVVSVGSRTDSPDYKGGLGHDGRDVEIHDVQNGRLVRRIFCPWTTSVRFSPNGNQVVVVADSVRPNGGSFGKQIRCFDRKTGVLLWSYGAQRGDQWNTAIFSPDGTTVAVYQTRQPQTILLLNAQGGTLKYTLKAQNRGDFILTPDSLAFSPDSKRLFARGKDAVLVWDLD